MGQGEKRKTLELQIRKLELEKDHKPTASESKAPSVKLKLPCFNQVKDDMDAFITRFEVYCTSQAITKEKWNLHLSTLLTGDILEATT